MKRKKIILSAILGVMIVALAVTGIAIALNRTGSDVTQLLSLGEKYLLELDYEQAVAAFLQVIEVEPMNVRAYAGAAEAYVALGQTDLAIEVLQKGYDATNDSSLDLLLELQLGEKYLAEHDYEQATGHFSRVLMIEPMYSRGYTGSAEARIALEQQEEAIGVLRAGLRLLPDDERINAMLDELLALQDTAAEPEVSAELDIVSEDPTTDTENCGTDGWMGYNSSSVFFCEDDGFWMMNKDGSGRKKIYEYGNGVTIYEITETHVYLYDQGNRDHKYDPLDKYRGAELGCVDTFVVIDVGTGAKQVRTFIELKIDWVNNVGFFLSDDLSQIMYFSIYEDAEPIELYRHPKQNEVIIEYSVSTAQNVPKLEYIKTTDKTDTEEYVWDVPWYYYKMDESGTPVFAGNDFDSVRDDEPYDPWRNATVMQNGNKVQYQTGALVIQKADGSEIIVLDSQRDSAPYLYTGKIPDRLYFWEVNLSNMKAALFYTDQNGENKTAMNLTIQTEYGYPYPIYYCDGYLCYYDEVDTTVRRMKPDGTENTVIYTVIDTDWYDYLELFVADTWVRLYDGVAGHGYYFNSYSELIPVR